MKKSKVGIICFIALLGLAACSNSTISFSPMATQTAVPERSATLIPVTITPTISLTFMALLSTETPFITATYVTPLPITGTPQPAINERISVEDEESIKKVIREYFDLRYYTFSTSNSNGLPNSLFDHLLSDEPETSVFLRLELAKLRMELKHFELNNLRHAAYEYFLDYESIFFDPLSQRATVSLSKRENTIHEISVMITPGEPIMSSGYNEKHTIILHKENGGWKIVSDEYRDYVWRMLRESGASTDEILHTLDSMLESAKAVPLTFDCFRSNQFSPYIPEQTTVSDSNAFSSPKIKTIYLNGKSYDPEWPYSYPFTNLYFEPDGKSPLRFFVELDNASTSRGQADAGWQIVIYPHVEDEKPTKQPFLVLDDFQEISCDSRTAFFVETSLEEIQKELGNHRVFDYQVVDEKGDIKLEHSFYLNPYGGYLISDTFGDVDRLDGGIIGYPYLMDESKTVFPREGQVIPVREPRGGFYRLHYFVNVSRLELPSGIWTEETSDEVVIQVFLYRDDGMYVAGNSYTIPDGRKIWWPKNYDFEVSFTIDELKKSLGDRNAFTLRFLDKNGNILGEDYFYFVPYSPPTP
jgi:hypothetical protein